MPKKISEIVKLIKKIADENNTIEKDVLSKLLVELMKGDMVEPLAMSLNVDYTDKQFADMAKKFVELDNAKERMVDDKQAAASRYKAKIEEQQGAIENIKEKILTGGAMSTVECFAVLDKKNKVKLIFRKDNLQTVKDVGNPIMNLVENKSKKKDEKGMCDSYTSSKSCDKKEDIQKVQFPVLKNGKEEFTGPTKNLCSECRNSLKSKYVFVNEKEGEKETQKCEANVNNPKCNYLKNMIRVQLVSKTKNGVKTFDGKIINACEPCRKAMNGDYKLVKQQEEKKKKEAKGTNTGKGTEPKKKPVKGSNKQTRK